MKAKRGRAKSQPLHLRIAASLEEEIRAGLYPTLPSIQQLAGKYGVSYVTQWKAHQHLVGKGVISASRGRCSRPLPAAAPAPPDSHRRVETTIRTNISQGIYRTGMALPKYAYFQQEHRVSYSSLRQVLHKLAHEGLIHKEGKRWIVGTPHRLRRWGGDSWKRSVLIVASTKGAWFELQEQPFTAPFGGQLLGEFRDFGLRTRLVLEQADPIVTDLPAGLGQALSLVDQMGMSYAGACIIHMRGEDREVGKWINALSSTGKPVVIFDGDNTRSSLTRGSLKLNGPFLRCHFDEPAAIELVTSALVSMGHKRIGLPFMPHADWIERRIEQFVQTARTAAATCEFMPVEMTEPFWGSENLYDIDAIVKTLRDGAVPAPRKRRVRRNPSVADLLRARTPSLARLLPDKGVTAWVGLNDEFGRRLSAWCDAAGVRIPADLSIVSLDNSPVADLFGLSSVDPGLSYLGYVAAHTIIGDISIPANRLGALAGKCRIVDRGQLGPSSGGTWVEKSSE